MNRIKNIIYLFIFILFISFNNVFAQEVQMEWEGNYASCIVLTDEDLTCKLTDDFNIGGLAGATNGNDDAWQVYHNVTLDLDGHTLDLVTNQLKFMIFSNYVNINIIDSSNSQTGTIIGGPESGVINIASSNFDYNNITLNIDGVVFNSSEYSSPSALIKNNTGCTIKVNIKDSVINGVPALFDSRDSFGDISLRSLEMNSSPTGTLRIDANKDTTLNISTVLFNKSMITYNNSSEVTKLAKETDNIYTVSSTGGEPIIIEEREIEVPMWDDPDYDNMFYWTGTTAHWVVLEETKDLVDKVHLTLLLYSYSDYYDLSEQGIYEDQYIKSLYIDKNVTSFDFANYLIDGLEYCFIVQYVDYNGEETSEDDSAWSNLTYYNDGHYDRYDLPEMDATFSKLNGTLMWDRPIGVSNYEVWVTKFDYDLDDFDYDNSAVLTLNDDVTSVNLSSYFERDGADFTGLYAVELYPMHSYDLMVNAGYYEEIDFEVKELGITLNNINSQGTVTWDPMYNLEEGTEITVTVDPAFGYMVDTNYTNIQYNGTYEPITQISDTVYKFTMPSSSVVLQVRYKPDTNLADINVNLSIDGQLSWNTVDGASYFKFSLYDITNGKTAIQEDVRFNKNSLSVNSYVGTYGKYRAEVTAYNASDRQISKMDQYTEAFIIKSWSNISSVILTGDITEPELDANRVVPTLSSSTATIKINQANTKWMKYNESTSEWDPFLESKFVAGKYRLSYQISSGVEVIGYLNNKLTNSTSCKLNGNSGQIINLVNNYSTNGTGSIVVLDSREYEIIPSGPVKLLTPANISINSSGVISWNSVNNADKYVLEIYKGNALQVTVESTTNSYDALDILYRDNSYFFKVKAVNNDSENYPESNFGISDANTFNGVEITSVNALLDSGNLLPGLVNNNSNSFDIILSSTQPINYGNVNITDEKWIYSSDNNWGEGNYQVVESGTKVKAGFYRPYLLVSIESHGVLLSDNTKLFIDSTEWDLINYEIDGSTTYCYFAGEYKEVEKLKDISLATYDITDYDYTGESITPSLNLKYNNVDLILDTDYTIAYSNNTNAGEATITVTGIGLYEGTNEINFNIKPRDISDNDVEIASSYEFTNSEIKPSPVLKDEDYTLLLNTDYELVYENNINVGTAKLIINYIGNYTGSKEIEFNIVGIDITDCNVTGYDDVYFDGTEKTFDLVVKVKGNTLTLNEDYLVSYKNNLNCGTATITITGKGNYSGIKEVTFIVLGKSLVELDYQDLPNYKYDGTEHKPSINVVDGSYLLVENKEYELTYENNIYKGNGIVIVHGIGNYSGTKQIEFTITQRDIENVTVNPIPEQAYSGNEVKPEVVVKDFGIELVNGVDYSVSYSNNINRGTATLVITADPNSNYSGSKEVSFEIGQKDIGTVVINKPSDVTYTGSKFEPVIEVIDNGNLLQLGVDYKVSYSNNINAGIAKVLVTALNNYSGAKELEFTINARDISEVLVSEIGSYKFDGNTKNPIPEVTLDGVELIKGTDYLLSYSNNINVGNAILTINGMGNYTGSHTENYVISKGDSFSIDTQSKNVVASNTNINVTLVPATLKIPTNSGNVTYSVQNYTNPTSTNISSCLVSGNSLNIELTNPTVGDTFTVTINVYTDNYEYSTFDYKFTLVDKYDQTLEVSNLIVTKKFGDKQFTNKINHVGDGKLFYSSTNMEVATVDNTGKVTIVGTGETTIVISAQETNNYAANETSYSLVVSKKVVNKPTITSEINYRNENINPIDYMQNYDSNIMEIVTNNYNQNKNAGSYQTKVELIDKNNYQFSDSSTSVTLHWTIVKTDPKFEVPNNVEATIGQTLKDVKLPANFEWNEPDTVLEIGTKTYLATYNTGNSNYNVIRNIEITVTTSNYEFEWVKNQKFVLDEDNESVVRVDAPFELFSHKVTIDDIELVEDVDYIASSGSTIITLSNQCLENLSKGNHELSIFFTNGSVVTTNFQVKENDSKLTGCEITMLILILLLILLIIIYIIYKRNKDKKKKAKTKRTKKIK